MHVGRQEVEDTTNGVSMPGSIDMYHLPAGQAQVQEARVEEILMTGDQAMIGQDQAMIDQEAREQTEEVHQDGWGEAARYC